MSSKNKLISIAKPLIGQQEINVVVKVLKSGQLAQGRKVEELEKAAAHFVGVKHAVAVSSGTAGLHVALLVLGIKSGDEVITTPFTFAATANTILAVGAKPVFVDIDPLTFNLDVTQVSKKINRRTKTVLPVSLFGLPYDSGQLKKVLFGSGIKIVEDACQSLGGKYKGHHSGSLGDLAVTSFYATKVITSGEGGMVFTNSERLNERLRLFRHHGQGQTYDYISFGLNFRLTDFQAALALAQLKRIDSFLSKRRSLAAIYDRELQDVPGIMTPFVPGGFSHGYSLYTVRVEESIGREKLRDFLKSQGVSTGVYYPQPLHLSSHFSRLLSYRKGDFPVAEKASGEVLSLPVHPGLTKSDVFYVCRLIKNYVEKNN